MKLVFRQGRLMVFLDEICFTKLAIQKKEWSRHNENLSVNQVDVYVGYRAVITTMTAEFGVGLSWIYNSAVNGDDFIEYLQALRRHYPNRPIALFMDNLNVHKKVEVKPYYERLNIVPVWNIGYSPEFAPIGKYLLISREKNCVHRGHVLQGEGTILPKTTPEPSQQDRFQLR